VYPNIPSAIPPVHHGDGLPVPETPDNFAMYSDDEDVSSNSEEQQPSVSRDADYLPSTDSSNHKITGGERNDLIRDLELPKKKKKKKKKKKTYTKFDAKVTHGAVIFKTSERTQTLSCSEYMGNSGIKNLYPQ